MKVLSLAQDYKLKQMAFLEFHKQSWRKQYVTKLQNKAYLIYYLQKSQEIVHLKEDRERAAEGVLESHRRCYDI